MYDCLKIEKSFTVKQLEKLMNMIIIDAMTAMCTMYFGEQAAVFVELGIDVDKKTHGILRISGRGAALNQTITELPRDCLVRVPNPFPNRPSRRDNSSALRERKTHSTR